MVTGGVGSIGSSIVRNLLKFNPKVVRIYDNNEHKLFEAQSLLKTHKNLRPLLGDIRDLERLNKAMNEIDIVFHSAALKHVEMSEYNPFEAVKTNIAGTQNVIDAALKENVRKVVFISTDKAVNPVSTMGATKLVAERLVTSSYYHKGNKRTKFAVVRFGNVLFSNGSVIPIWVDQIRNGGSITITHPEMTRFLMPVEEAVDLVFQAAMLMKGGEIFILKMPSVKVKELAEALIEYLAPLYQVNPSAVKIKIVGLRAGEKMHEELITREESLKLYQNKNMYIIVPNDEILSLNMRNSTPKFKKVKKFEHYSSDSQILLAKKQIMELLKKAHINEH